MKRLLTQIGFFFAANLNLAGFIKGKIYQGPLKNMCVPGLNCYSCPGALGACPIGALQAVIGSAKYQISPSKRDLRPSTSPSSPPWTKGNSRSWLRCGPGSLGNIVFLGPPGDGKTHLATALGMEAARHRFSTYYINCQKLIEQLKKAHFENKLPDRLRVLSRFKLLIIDEIGYLPMDIQGTNLFFQLIARRYEKTSTIFTSNRPFSQWNDIFSDVTIASAILDRVLHHCTAVNIKGESYRLKERKE